MSAHTPGPWRIGEDDPTYIYAGNDQIAEVNAPGFGREVVKTDLANAHLIAAAPDLLKALQETVICLGLQFLPDHPVMISARAAISKATGE